MCGIVGFSGRRNADVLARMSKAIRHRGPDDAGSFVDPDSGVALAARRLAIVDLPGGRQPFSDPSGRYTLVFNGEIYNAPELRAELRRGGWRLSSSHSDTECLLYLYIRHGADMLRKLNGMFAFVVYDRVAGKLFGARDRAGIKPLFYHWQDGRLTFASELKALLQCPWVSRSINQSSLHHYAGLEFVPAPASIFSEVNKLAAGRCFRLDLGSQAFAVERYWNLPVNRTVQCPEPDWRERLGDELNQAVARWSRSDLPIACSLSGGIDSAGIVGLLTRSGHQDLRTYSVGFGATEDRGVDELALARQVARHCSTRHQEIRIGPQDVANDLDRMVDHLDEPYAGGLPSWYVYQTMAQDVKVALTGLGADELFGSYGKYRIFEAPRYTRLAWRLRQLWRFRLADYLLPHSEAPRGFYFHHHLTDAFKRRLFSSAVHANVSTAKLMEQGWRESNASNPRDAVCYLEFQHQLPEEFLQVSDRFSMAHSVEARTPYLDHQLVERVFALPAHLRAADQPYKQTLRSLLEDVVPAEVLHSPKRGFTLPLRNWTRGPFREQILDSLSDERLRRQGLFSPATVQRLLQQHMQSKQDFTHQVWMLFMFQRWHDRFA